MFSNLLTNRCMLKESIGDVVELVELLCLAILSTPIEGTKNVGKIQNTVGELLGATIRTRFEDE